MNIMGRSKGDSEWRVSRGVQLFALSALKSSNGLMVKSSIFFYLGGEGNNMA